METPKKGDIIKLAFGESTGHEQAGYRPALVISDDRYNARSGMAIVCSITNQVKNPLFEVPLPATIQTTGVVLINHIYNIDWYERNAKIVDHVPSDLTDEVLAKIGIFLGIIR